MSRGWRSATSARPKRTSGGPGRSYEAANKHFGNGRPDAIPFTGRVEVFEYLGAEQLVHITRNEAQLQAKLRVDERLSVGEEREFSVARDKVFLFDKETEERVRG